MLTHAPKPNVEVTDLRGFRAGPVDCHARSIKSEGPSDGATICSLARLDKLTTITDISAVILNGNNTGTRDSSPSNRQMLPLQLQLCAPWEKVD